MLASSKRNAPRPRRTRRSPACVSSWSPTASRVSGASSARTQCGRGDRSLCAAAVRSTACSFARSRRRGAGARGAARRTSAAAGGLAAARRAREARALQGRSGAPGPRRSSNAERLDPIAGLPARRGGPRGPEFAALRTKRTRARSTAWSTDHSHGRERATGHEGAPHGAMDSSRAFVTSARTASSRRWCGRPATFRPYAASRAGGALMPRRSLRRGIARRILTRARAVARAQVGGEGRPRSRRWRQGMLRTLRRFGLPDAAACSACCRWRRRGRDAVAHRVFTPAAALSFLGQTDKASRSKRRSASFAPRVPDGERLQTGRPSAFAGDSQRPSNTRSPGAWRNSEKASSSSPTA